MLDIQIERGLGYTVCRPIGDLDAFTACQFREVLTEVPGDGSLLLDMSRVPFMDSAGLGALIGGIRRTRELGGDVAVSCNQPNLIRLLRTTGFDRVVTIAETIEQAAAVLTAEGAPS